MELRIDGQPCDLGTKSIAVPGYDASKLAGPETCREGRSLKITIPATPRNDAVTAFAGDPHAAGRFNDTLHTAELTSAPEVWTARGDTYTPVDIASDEAVVQRHGTLSCLEIAVRPKRKTRMSWN